jgi:ParB/RepB/Spo0J family partition protein
MVSVKLHPRLKVNQIKVPRTFKREAVVEDEYLLNSIRDEGLKDPIYVLKDGTSYVIVDGIRRLRCCKKLKHATIPALAEKYANQMGSANAYAAFLRLIIDTKRQDLLPSQRAYYINLLTKKYDIPISEISKAYGRSESALRVLMNISSCDEEIRMRIDNRTFPIVAAKLASKLSRKGQRSMLHYFYGRSKVSADEISNWINRLDPVRDTDLFKDVVKSQKAKKRSYAKRVSRTYSKSSAIGQSITDAESSLEDVRKEIRYIRDGIRHARPIVEFSLNNKKFMKMLPSGVVSDFKQFAEIEGIQWK